MKRAVDKYTLHVTTNFERDRDEYIDFKDKMTMAELQDKIAIVMEGRQTASSYMMIVVHHVEMVEEA